MRALEEPRHGRGKQPRHRASVLCSSAPIPTPTGCKGSGIALDDKGFVVTGADAAHALATSREGVFAIGDVRAGSVKRVAAAVGEGAQVVAALHAFLADAQARSDRRQERMMARSLARHLDTIRKVTPSALGCEECLKMG